MDKKLWYGCLFCHLQLQKTTHDDQQWSTVNQGPSNYVLWRVGRRVQNPSKIRKFRIKK